MAKSFGDEIAQPSRSQKGQTAFADHDGESRGNLGRIADSDIRLDSNERRAPAKAA
jgi:hypothetical protein